MRKSAYLQITRECNNECIFCSNPPVGKDYSFEEAKKRVIEFKEEGVNELILTGGEPTEADFLPDLIEFIKNNNMETKLVSNCVNFSDKKLVKNLYKRGLMDCYISIHSVKEEISDRLSQKKGNFKKSIKGLENLISLGIKVNINSTINSLNCDHLSKNVAFFIKNFPQITHFVFNNLDPGSADGEVSSRAKENPWIVARFVDFELELQKMVSLLKKNNKSFRIERVPLCYMEGAEEFSTETRKIIKNEEYICSFINKRKPIDIRKVMPEDMRSKIGCCGSCRLNVVCAGVQKEILDVNGSKEIYPVFKDPRPIIEKVKNGL